MTPYAYADKYNLPVFIANVCMYPNVSKRK